MTFKRVVSLILLATMPACMSTVRVAPNEYLAQNRPMEMLVVDDLGDMYVLSQPTVVNGNIVGVEMGTPDTVSVPVEQVQEAMVKQKSPGKTAALVSTLTLMTAAGVVFVATGGLKKPCRNIGDGAVALNVGGRDHCDTSGPDGGGTEN
jgi:hypothetical protein